LKEAFIKITSAAADHRAETVLVRRRAAVLSLALSMGTTGILLSKSERVHAATTLPPEVGEVNLILNDGERSSHPSLPRIASAETPDRVLNPTASAIEHEVKVGESLWLLSRAYHTTPEAIATINQISPSAELKLGQTLKIPTPEQLQTEPLPETSTSEQLDSVSDSLRQTRQRLQDSLATLRSRETTLIASEPTALVPGHGDTESGVEIPVVPSEESATDSERVIPIAVPTPESDRSVTVTRSPRYLGEPLPAHPEPFPSVSPENEPMLEVPAIPAPRVIIPAENTVYRVRPGDTLNTIARDLGISSRELAKANGISNPNRIRVNQALVIPDRAARHRERPIATRSPIDPRPPLSLKPSAFADTDRNEQMEPAEAAIATTYTDKLREDIASLRGTRPTEQQKAIALTVDPPANQPSGQILRNPQWMERPSRLSRLESTQIIGTAPTNVEEYNDRLRIPVGETVTPSLPPLSDPDEHLPGTPFNGYIWPTRGVLTSGFGWRWGRPHRGIDIAGPIGTPIVAAAPGEVISAGWNSGGYGNLVRIRHADGSVTLYAHNSRLRVRRGETVEQGQPIAEMGSTGFSTGPHLHFEVHPDGQGAVNPIALLPNGR
jgi:murein DD-endopeptidase MepM/ murein hydrolase activator NlpD